MDTLLLMGLEPEFDAAVDWVADHFDYRSEPRKHVFEDNIRILGGLLSAYELSGKKVLLEKAERVGQDLLLAFRNNSRLPCGVIDHRHPSECHFPYGTQQAYMAEVGTLALEWNTLSEHTSNSIWREKIAGVNEALANLSDPLLFEFIDVHTEDVSGKQTVSGGVDSAYEYLLKQWIAEPRNSLVLGLWREALAELNARLLRRIGNWSYFAEGVYSGVQHPKQSHLACFIAGSLLQSGATELGLELVRTCVHM